MKNIMRTLSFMTLMVSFSFAFANCPASSAMRNTEICVTNHTNSSVIYNQLPDNIGNVEIAAQETKTITDLKAEGPEQVVLRDTAGNVLVNQSIATCMSSSILTEDGWGSWWIVRGCQH